MATYLQNNSYIKLTGWDLTREFSERGRHSITELHPLLRSNGQALLWIKLCGNWFVYKYICVFFIPDAMIAVNPFLDRMPRELHEQYMTDVLTEFMKLPETNKAPDDVTTFKYGLIVALARKSWKLQPSIGKICANTNKLGISPGNNAPYNPRKPRTQNCAQPSCVEKDRLKEYTNVLNRTWISTCVHFCFKLLFTYK